MKDLVILVADKTIEQTMLGLLERKKSPEIRKDITCDIVIHLQRGSRLRARRRRLSIPVP
ncbi:hypothetical protein [Thioalkalivibrio sp. HK1]|uniref:hypothetical protein n=1 Tax=Thioalkalivibrio sp. HK1 TaxID=1469245 RepID=UPI00046F2C0D|nr:hypothetical protein [Thioalkalivibrio sp. HK1]